MSPTWLLIGADFARGLQNSKKAQWNLQKPMNWAEVLIILLTPSGTWEAEKGMCDLPLTT